jgi:type-F conjugative transfer system secretin TraK
MKKLIYILTFLFLMGSQALASQIKQVYDGIELPVQISAIDLNRISLVNDVIVSAHSDAGELSFSQDKTTGDLYISTVSKHSSKRSYSLFLITKKKQTYKLLIVGRRIPSEQIILHNISLSSEDGKQKENDSYKDSILSFSRKILSGEVPSGYEVSSRGKIKKYLSATRDSKLRYKVLKRYGSNTAGAYSAYIIDIKNISKAEAILSEEGIYKPGVKAISFEKKILLPREKTRMLLVL